MPTTFNQTQQGSPTLPARADFADRSITLSDGRVLSYAEYGDPLGLPVFAFHGTPGSRFMFRLAREPSFKIGLRIIAPERPGFGNSTFQKDRRLCDWANDVRALADALKIEKFGLAGISGGGPYVVACAALLPDRALAGVIVSPVGPVAKGEGPVKIGLQKHLFYRLFYRLRPFSDLVLTLGRLGFLYAPSLVYPLLKLKATGTDVAVLSRQAVRDNLVAGVAEGFRPGIAGTLAELRIFAGRWDLPFAAIRCPIHIWQGLKDGRVCVGSTQKLAQLIPNCHLTLVDDGGHYWIFDHIVEVLAAMKEAMVAAQHSRTGGLSANVSH